MSATTTNRRRQWCGSASDRHTVGVKEASYDAFTDVKEAAHKFLMRTDEAYAPRHLKFKKLAAARKERRSA